VLTTEHGWLSGLRFRSRSWVGIPNGDGGCCCALMSVTMATMAMAMVHVL
jgi:hypothetical protein